MLKDAFEILNIIENNGFQAYIVGGYVRDKILGIKSFDIDITTSAKPQDLLHIFKNIEITNDYGTCVLKYNDYKYEITTFRKDISYDDYRRPKNIEFVDTLYEDLHRRDFTINTLCMDKNGNIIDLLGAMSDIENKIIRCVGNPKIKIREDALRIIRAIRFASVLNFKIEPILYEEIRNNSHILSYLSYDRKKDELSNIFKGLNFNYGLDLIKELKLDEKLEIEVKNDVIYTSNVLGIWSQIKFSNKYNFSNKEKKLIENIRILINKGTIDIFDIYIMNKEVIDISSEILKIDCNNLFSKLKITKRSDINISANDIMSNFNVSFEQINKIYVDLEKEILYNNLINEREEILTYLRTKYEMR